MIRTFTVAVSLDVARIVRIDGWFFGIAADQGFGLTAYERRLFDRLRPELLHR